MAHLVILDPETGTISVIEHDEEGNRIGQPQTYTFDTMPKHDHAPSEISIKGLNLEDANKVFKLLKKIYRK